MKPARIGATLTQSFEVTAGDTAAAIGNTGVDVVSTMTLVKLIETACYGVIEACYEDGDATVGTHVALDHTGPAYPGRTVEIAATLSGLEGRRYTFEVDVSQDGRAVMSGEHVRVVVRSEKFSSGPVAQDGPAPQVEFWFDVHSPWCYFASYRIGNLLRSHGGSVIWRPVHLPRLMDLIDGRRPLDANDNFVRWYQQDIRDHAELHGLPFDQHENYPLRPARALRTCLYAAEQGEAEIYVQRLMRAYWSEQADISDVATLAALGVEAGLCEEGIAGAAGDEGYKTQIIANTAEAAQRGLFGVPAMIFEGKIFWGNDRIDLLDRFIGRWKADATG